MEVSQLTIAKLRLYLSTQYICFLINYHKNSTQPIGEDQGKSERGEQVLEKTMAQWLTEEWHVT